LIFYVRSPVKSIVGVYEVTSKVFEESTYRPWEDRFYPYRVRIKPLSTDLKELSEPIPLEASVGKVSKIKSSQPFMGKSMVPLTKEDYGFIKSLIEKHAR
jgi:predicted RNA-binding protein